MADDMLKFPYINSKGFGTIPKLVMQDRELGVIAKAVYAYLCSYAGGGDRCFPTRDKMCRDLNISIGCLSKYIKQLSDRGYVRITQKTESGKFSHNVYEILSEINVDSEDGGGTYEDAYLCEAPVEEAPKTEKKPEKKKSTRFVPPTLEEVKEYAKSIGSTVDPEEFYDYYLSNGWKVNKNSMKDWQATFRNWGRRNKGGNVNAEQSNGYKGFTPSKGFKG